MLSFRKVEFDNGAIVFLRPKEHDQQIGNLTAQVMNNRVVIQDMSIEKAAAWSMAVHLFHMPTSHYTH